MFWGVKVICGCLRSILDIFQGIFGKAFFGLSFRLFYFILGNLGDYYLFLLGLLGVSGPFCSNFLCVFWIILVLFPGGGFGVFCVVQEYSECSLESLPVVLKWFCSGSDIIKTKCPDWVYTQGVTWDWIFTPVPSQSRDRIKKKKLCPIPVLDEWLWSRSLFFLVSVVFLLLEWSLLFMGLLKSYGCFVMSVWMYFRYLHFFFPGSFFGSLEVLWCLDVFGFCLDHFWNCFLFRVEWFGRLLGYEFCLLRFHFSFFVKVNYFSLSVCSVVDIWVQVELEILDFTQIALEELQVTSTAGCWE